MEIKSAIVEAVVEMFQMFGLSVLLKEDTFENHQFPGEYISVLIGLTEALKGNVIMGFNKSTACSIVSAMMGGVNITELDFMAQSALGEFANMTLGSAIVKLKPDKVINLSPPTVAIAEDISLTVSSNNSNKLIFQLDEDLFNIIVSTD